MMDVPPTYVSEPVTVSPRARPATVVERLQREGFAHIGEDALGFTGDLRKHLLEAYFNAGVLRSDLPDVPPDRERARDVVYYQWRPGTTDRSDAGEHEAGGDRAGGDLEAEQLSASAEMRLVGHTVTAIVDRDGRPGPRDYVRVPFAADPDAAEWVATILSLLPLETRWSDGGRGTFGINLFRTHTQVVTRPHHDDEEYVIVYVVDKVGGGAETDLYDVKTGKRVYSAVLQPGDLIIFKDAAFLHDVTPLTPPPDGHTPCRDALVCTVNHRGTYPLDRDLWTPGPAPRVPAPRGDAGTQPVSGLSGLADPLPSQQSVRDRVAE